jgi:hypothetical protein
MAGLPGRVLVIEKLRTASIGCSSSRSFDSAPSSVVSRDQSVTRSAQDDDSVGVLKNNIPNKLAFMGRLPGKDRETESVPKGTAEYFPCRFDPDNKCEGAPCLAGFSRDVGYHDSQPEVPIGNCKH